MNGLGGMGCLEMIGLLLETAWKETVSSEEEIAEASLEEA